MENITEILKLLIITALAIGYLVKIFKGEKANDILGSLINSIEHLGSKDLKKKIGTEMAKTEMKNFAALDNVVQKVTKGKKANKIWDVIKFIVPFVL